MQITQEQKTRLIDMMSGFGPLRIAITNFVMLETCNAIKAGDTTQYTLDQVIETVLDLEAQVMPDYLAKLAATEPQPSPIVEPPVVEPPPETPVEPPVEPPLVDPAPEEPA